jgi:type I restriction enzyme M protein
LVIYVEDFLFPYLRGLKGTPEREAIGSIFADMRGVVMDSGYNLRDVLDIIDAIDFRNTDDIHTVSFVYEDLLKRMGSENRVAGEFYTPRPVVRFMVQMVDPKIGETVYDPACGSAGFLVESYLHMKQAERTARDHETLQRRTFYGQEKKPLPALLGLINMVLHGVLTPNISRRNTLEENIRDVSERFDVILTNPPFGGRENRQIQRNFPVQSQATELLFLQHIMKKLKQDGRCAVVVPEGTLFRGDAFAAVKKDLLENFSLHTIVSLPQGVFLPYSGVKTNLIFFDRSGPTRQVWYYELLPPPEVGKYTKGKPIQDAHFDDCRRKWTAREISEVSWIEPVERLVERGYDLTARNPNRNQEVNHRPPEEIAASIAEKERRILEMAEELRAVLKGARHE